MPLLPDFLDLLRADSNNMLDLDGLADLLEDWEDEGLFPVLTLPSCDYVWTFFLPLLSLSPGLTQYLYHPLTCSEKSDAIWPSNGIQSGSPMPSKSGHEV